MPIVRKSSCWRWFGHGCGRSGGLYNLLAAGKLDAVVNDAPIAKCFSRFLPGLQFSGTLADTEAAYAIAVRRGNDSLREEVNEPLQEMTTDGTRRTLLEKWSGDLTLPSGAACSHP